MCRQNALFPVCCIAVAEWIFAAKTLEEADSQLYWCVTLRPRLAGRTQSLVSDFICRTSPRQLCFQRSVSNFNGRANDFGL